MEKMIKIRACIDFSEYSLITLDYAVKLAKGKNAEIVVYHVINDRDFKYFDLANLYIANRSFCFNIVDRCLLR